jgi:hypothetical protein
MIPRRASTCELIANSTSRHNHSIIHNALVWIYIKPDASLGTSNFSQRINPDAVSISPWLLIFAWIPYCGSSSDTLGHRSTGLGMLGRSTRNIGEQRERQLREAVR